MSLIWSGREPEPKCDHRVPPESRGEIQILHDLYHAGFGRFYVPGCPWCAEERSKDEIDRSQG